MRLNFDFIAKGSFQTTADGQRVFYPNGMIGKGYIIESDERYRRLFRQQKYWGLAIMALVTLLVSIKAGGLIILSAFIALNLLKQLVTRRTTRHMPIAAARYSVAHFLSDSLPLHKLSRGKRLALSISGILGCLCLALLAASGWYPDPDSQRRLMTGAFVCGLVACLALRALRAAP